MKFTGKTAGNSRRVSYDSEEKYRKLRKKYELLKGEKRSLARALKEKNRQVEELSGRVERLQVEFLGYKDLCENVMRKNSNGMNKRERERVDQGSLKVFSLVSEDVNLCQFLIEKKVFKNELFKRISRYSLSKALRYSFKIAENILIYYRSYREETGLSTMSGTSDSQFKELAEETKNLLCSIKKQSSVISSILHPE